MTNYEIKMPANFAAIEEEEMTYLMGGADTPAWLTYMKNVGNVFGNIARVFSSANSIISNINNIYNAVVALSKDVPGLFTVTKTV